MLGKTSWAAASRTATFMPDAPLETSTTYRAIVDGFDGLGRGGVVLGRGPVAIGDRAVEREEQGDAAPVAGGVDRRVGQEQHHQQDEAADHAIDVAPADQPDQEQDRDELEQAVIDEVQAVERAADGSERRQDGLPAEGRDPAEAERLVEVTDVQQALDERGVGHVVVVHVGPDERDAPEDVDRDQGRQRRDQDRHLGIADEDPDGAGPADQRRLGHGDLAPGVGTGADHQQRRQRRPIGHPDREQGGGHGEQRGRAPGQAQAEVDLQPGEPRDEVAPASEDREQKAEPRDAAPQHAVGRG